MKLSLKTTSHPKHVVVLLPLIHSGNGHSVHLLTASDMQRHAYALHACICIAVVTYWWLTLLTSISFWVSCEMIEATCGTNTSCSTDRLRITATTSHTDRLRITATTSHTDRQTPHHSYNQPHRQTDSASQLQPATQTDCASQLQPATQTDRLRITATTSHNQRSSIHFLRGGSVVWRCSCDLQVTGLISDWWLSSNIGQLSLASLRGS